MFRFSRFPSPGLSAGPTPLRSGILFAAALCLLAGAAPGRAAGSAERLLLAESQTSVAAIVWGIVSYTRWPAQPEVLRACLAGHSAHADTLRRSADWLGPERRSLVRQLAPGENPAEVCDLVYAGELAPAARTHLLNQLAGTPVLTIGEGAGFCSAGGMFCLEQDGSTAGARFSANLDAISRSSLRINPQVLRLSRQLRGVGS